MKTYLQHIVTDLKNYSKSLDKKAILVDKPWALIDSDLEIQKLIFKKNNELVMSKDGHVVVGHWEYFAEAKSILIDRGYDKILCNEGFIDDGVLILKLDGTKSEYFVLANENIIPDLDAYKYLQNLRYKSLNIIAKKLTNGKMLEIHRGIGEYHARIGNNVTIDLEKIENGIYGLNNHEYKFVVENSSIVGIIYEVSYKCNNGIEIIVEQNQPMYFSKGDTVWIEGKAAPDGKYRVLEAKNIMVKNGKIFKKYWI